MAFGLVEGSCKASVGNAKKRACPDGLRDDGTSCWLDSYGRGVGRTPDKASCPSGTRDDGTSCWKDSYGRGAGRTPDKAPCPAGLRDDGTSCWSDAHIYGKGCCCTLWGCCNECKPGYNDDGCTCRKTDVGIKLNLFQRQKCRSDEDKYGALCYPKCKAGYRAVGCCICQPDDAHIVKTLAQRQSCNSNEERYGALCYPKCKNGFRAVGCCICEPDGGPGIKLTLFDRYYCTGHSVSFLSFCLNIDACPILDLVDKMKDLGVDLSTEQLQQLTNLLKVLGKYIS